MFNLKIAPIMKSICEFFTATELKTAGISKKKLASLMEDHFEFHNVKTQITPNGVWVLVDDED